MGIKSDILRAPDSGLSHTCSGEVLFGNLSFNYFSLAVFITVENDSPVLFLYQWIIPSHVKYTP